MGKEEGPGRLSSLSQLCSKTIKLVKINGSLGTTV